MPTNYLRFVLDQFLQHKVRFVLTISGIVVGVASLALLASILTVGKGVLRQASWRASGQDLVTVADEWKTTRKYPNEKRLSDADNAILARSRTLRDVSFSPQYGMRPRDYIYQGKDGNTLTVGLSPTAFVDNDLEIALGRDFYRSEYDDYSRVVVVGASLLESHSGSPIGDLIQVEGYKLRIVGVLKRKPTVGPGKDHSWNSRILMPAATYNILLNPSKKPESILARVHTGAAQSLEASISAAETMMTQILMMRRQHKNFRIDGTNDKEGNEKTILIVIQALIISTTVFSMIVGGINIMNIMLVTVTERTREIGIRRALGATKRDILGQFLLESVLVTMSGALVGLFFAVGLLYLASVILTQIYYPWPFHVTWWSVILGMTLTIVIGVTFGLSPALKAAKLDPVEALRYE